MLHIIICMRRMNRFHSKDKTSGLLIYLKIWCRVGDWILTLQAGKKDFLLYSDSQRKGL